MMKKLVAFLVVVVAFISGGAVVYFALRPCVQPRQTMGKPVVNSPTTAPKPTYNSAHLVAPNEVQQVIDLLRNGFIDAPALAGQEINASTLPVILEKLGTKAWISPTSFSKEAPFVKAELAGTNIGYWRVSGFAKDTVGKLADAWNLWKNPIGLIIDLRDFQSMNAYAEAADFAGLLITPNTTLFSIQGIHSPQKVFQALRQPLKFPSTTPLVVLIGPETRGAGEVLAYILKQHAQAILIGEATAGEAAVYDETQLSSGRFLYRAMEEAIATSGQRLLGTPILPDIAVNADDAEQIQILQKEKTQSVNDMIRELPKRPRLNEAALVHEEDEDLDAAMSDQAKQTEKKAEPMLDDEALHRAVDVIRAITIQKSEPPPQPAENNNGKATKKP